MGKTQRKALPARTPEARENQLINLAMNLAEEKLRDGTASSQIITTLIHLGTAKYQLENEKLRSDLEVAQAKIEQMKNQSDIGALYEKAISVFRTYSGAGEIEDDIDDEEY